MRTFAVIFAGLIALPPLHEAAAAVVVTYRGSSPNPFSPNNNFANVPFDINADGTADFLFTSNLFFASFDTLGTNRVAAFIDPTEFYVHQVIPVSFGAEIGPGSAFPYVDPVFPGFGDLPGAWHSGDEIAYPAGFLLGYDTSGFMQYSNAYIGVEFMAADGIHYGWIQYQGFSVAFPFAINVPGGWVNSWGYETQPNTPLFAGQVPELSRAVFLLLGITSLFFRRRRVKGGTNRWLARHDAGQPGRLHHFCRRRRAHGSG